MKSLGLGRLHFAGFLGLALSSSIGLVAACSSSSSSGGGGGDDASTPDSSTARDAGPLADGGYDSAQTPDVQTPCGDGGNCTYGQACVTFTTSGGSCRQLTDFDASSCPSGTASCMVDTDGGPIPGCTEYQVNQMCETLSPDCNGTPSCAVDTCFDSLCATCDPVCDAGNSATTFSCTCLGQ